MQGVLIVSYQVLVRSHGGRAILAALAGFVTLTVYAAQQSPVSLQGPTPLAHPVGSHLLQGGGASGWRYGYSSLFALDTRRVRAFPDMPHWPGSPIYL